MIAVRRWAALAIYSAIFLGVACVEFARAEDVAPAPSADRPCVPQGDTVVCLRPGFDALVKRVVTRDADAKACAVRLDAMTHERDDVAAGMAAMQKKLEDVLATPPPPPPSALRPAVGFALGVVGTVAVAIAPVLTEASVGARMGLGGLGVAAIGTGLWLVLPSR